VGNEIDLLIEKNMELIPVEIKSGQTITNDYFKGLNFWNKITNSQGGYVVYGGEETQRRSNEITVLPLGQINSMGNIL
jgi:predicted AAA+ superfamily ATPase